MPTSNLSSPLSLAQSKAPLPMPVPFQLDSEILFSLSSSSNPESSAFPFPPINPNQRVTWMRRRRMRENSIFQSISPGTDLTRSIILEVMRIMEWGQESPTHKNHALSNRSFHVHSKMGVGLRSSFSPFNSIVEDSFISKLLQMVMEGNEMRKCELNWRIGINWLKGIRRGVVSECVGFVS